jgi:hypothetical protein
MDPKFRVVLAACTLLIFAALITLRLTRGPGSAEPPPAGTQTYSGLVLRTKLSIMSRGTHVLIRADSGAILLESQASDLSAFEGKHVRAKGRFVENTPPYPPVLVVTEIRELDVSSSAASESASSASSKRSLHFQSSNPSTGSEGSDGSDHGGSGKVCGGAAGVLCDEGEYCSITDWDKGIGVCKKL